MAINNLLELGANPTIDNQDVDQYFNALVNDFVPRNESGQPESEAGRLGTPTYPWDKLYVKNNIYIDGSPVGGSGSSGALVDDANYILSGSVLADGNTPNFIDVSGSTNSVTILATTVPLEVVINGAATSFLLDVTVTGLTAAPGSNNTCLVNNGNYAAQNPTKLIREIEIDTIGTEISNRNGQICGFLLNGEYFLALVDTTNSVLRVVRRGAFLDSSGVKIARATVSDNATITLMSTAWIYAENTGTTCVVSYKSPSYSGIAPTSPATGDYWYDLINREWNIWSGSAWTVVDRTLIGVCLINSSSVAIAGMAYDPRIDALHLNNFKLRKLDAGKVVTTKTQNACTVYGNFHKFNSHLVWDMAAHLDTGLAEASNTQYYFYLTEEAKPKIAIEAPEWRDDLGAFYHPYKTWLYMGCSLNDGSSNLGFVKSHADEHKYLSASTSGFFGVNVDFKKYVSYRMMIKLSHGGGGLPTIEASSNWNTAQLTPNGNTASISGTSTITRSSSLANVAIGSGIHGFIIDFYQPTLSGDMHYTVIGHASNNSQQVVGGGYITATAAVNFISIKPSSGTMVGEILVTPGAKRHESYEGNFQYNDN